MTNLTELALDDNLLTGWDPDTFEKVPLKNLTVRSNNINSITEEMLAPILNSLGHFQAENNPYYCQCNLSWYSKWLSEQNRETQRELQLYKCWLPSDMRGELLIDYQPTVLDCWPVLQVSGGGVGLIAIVILCVILYRKRWSLRYWWYLIRMKKKRHTELQENAKRYQYDGFVSFSNDDSEWVFQCIQKMEEDGNTKLCFHTRDFQPNRYITDSIVESIENSRRTVVVLSKNYAKSEWCRFEVNMAHTHRIKDSRDFILLIMLGSVPVEDMSPKLRYMVRHKTYLEWSGDDESGQELFWHKLKDALKKPEELI